MNNFDDIARDEQTSVEKTNMRERKRGRTKKEKGFNRTDLFD